MLWLLIVRVLLDLVEVLIDFLDSEATQTKKKIERLVEKFLEKLMKYLQPGNHTQS